MSVERYPEGLILALQDFTESGWRGVLTDSAPEDYSTMWHTFSSAAQKAMETKQRERAKVLWLLADASSMMLRPKSVNEPYQPIMVIDGKRSMIPDDFSDTDIVFFAKIVDDIDDVRLKARVADLVWLRGSPVRSSSRLLPLMLTARLRWILKLGYGTDASAGSGLLA